MKNNALENFQLTGYTKFAIILFFPNDFRISYTAGPSLDDTNNFFGIGFSVLNFEIMIGCIGSSKLFTYSSIYFIK